MGKETVKELKEKLVRALSLHDGVEAIATFGSMAKGSFDQYSDIDMLVSVSSAMVGLDQIKNFEKVMYYRSFSSARYPSGRYWIKGYSPFNKIDISFHLPKDFQRIIRYGDPDTYKSPPFFIEWTNNPHSEKDMIPAVVETETPYICSDIEKEISKLVYHLSLSLKASYRGQKAKYNLSDTYAALKKKWHDNKGAKWSGGDLDHLVSEILTEAKSEMVR